MPGHQKGQVQPANSPRPRLRIALTDRCAPLAIAGKQAQLLHAQADGGARRELPRAEAHERLGDAAMRKEQPECAKEEEYAGVRLLLHAMPAHFCPTTAADWRPSAVVAGVGAFAIPFCGTACFHGVHN